MPLYEYKCKSCGTLFEVRQKFVDEPLKTHDVCGGEVERLISVPSLNFKGTGWYVTDYGNKSANGKSSHEKSNKDSHKESGSGDSAT
jgi:putative FmdB family regulatory protein